VTKKYGHLDVESHTSLKRGGVDIRVMLNGVDVTDRCQEADDVTGRVRVLCRDAEHRNWRTENTASHIMPDADDRPCVLVVTGDVDMVPR
jgi:hypothetical protein